MTTAITNLSDLPKDTTTGLTLPLSKSLGSQGLAKHRAMIGVELEVMAKKFDRFGWERDRGSAAHDRIVTDWMDALQDYPLDEVREACREWVKASPRKMPNEGDILWHLRALRRVKAERYKDENPTATSEDPDPRVTPEAAAQILAAAGFAPKTFGQEAAE